MEIEQKSELHNASISAVLRILKEQKRLAPLLRSTTPEGERRLNILKSLYEDLNNIKDDGAMALEFIGFMDIKRFERAFGVKPEKLSEEFSHITFQKMTYYSYSITPDCSSLAGNLSYPWPKFTAENEDRAKAFVKELLKYVNSIIASYGEK